MSQSFFRAQRHIGSRVTKLGLGVDLLYPDFESGLTAILEVEQPPD